MSEKELRLSYCQLSHGCEMYIRNISPGSQPTGNLLINSSTNRTLTEPHFVLRQSPRLISEQVLNLTQTTSLHKDKQFKCTIE